jgi:prephenate dehydratase
LITYVLYLSFAKPSRGGRVTIERVRIAIQGEVGSFHEAAAKQWFGDNCHILPQETFRGVFEALKTGRARAAVVAIENSNYGPIAESLQLLKTYGYPVVGEVSLPVHQQLITLPGAVLATITRVYSHPVALGQSSDFLESHLPQAKRIDYFDTAAAVRYIKEQGNPNYAAIASRGAAALYQLPILAADIENDKTNVTRFAVLQP